MAIQSLYGYNALGIAGTGNSGNAAVAPNQQTPRTTDAVASPLPPSSASGQPAQQAEPSLSEVKKAADDVQKVVQARAGNLQFSVDQDEDAGRAIVKLMDKQSGEVILQIPSKEMVSIAKEIDKLLGVFVKQKV